ncbi:hypothetical protein [Paludibaculum fermentans]|uniref:Uncharacterized protein n=1 Tax=Paludibaculum fermentans TaxID=1473598 RepID=A0A7S7NMK8_PALFE|nr:hypothetical protein [Paludibaculum fermentans]QOY86403.1 hypothetical protein IRI77_26875 [Paludibaculum fermentans]
MKIARAKLDVLTIWLNRPTSAMPYLAQTCAFLVLSERVSLRLKDQLDSSPFGSLSSGALTSGLACLIGILFLMAIANAHGRFRAIGCDRWYMYLAVGALAVVADALMLLTVDKRRIAYLVFLIPQLPLFVGWRAHRSER